MLRSLLAVAMLACPMYSFSQDAVQTDGDKYRVLLENDCVRVLDYRDVPGAVTQQHTHPAFVLYALSPFERSITLADGKVLRRQFKAHDVMYSPAQTHIGKNTGETPTHVIITELKGVTGPCAPR